jgi:hypothetical protein
LTPLTALSDVMNTNRYRIDAPGCHCQSCVDGTSTPLDRATEEQLVALLDGSADDRTGIVASGSLDGVTVRVLWQCYAKVVLPDSDDQHPSPVRLLRPDGASWLTGPLRGATPPALRPTRSRDAFPWTNQRRDRGDR